MITHHDAHSPNLPRCGAQSTRDLQAVLVHGVLDHSLPVNAIRDLQPPAVLQAALLVVAGCTPCSSETESRPTGTCAQRQVVSNRGKGKLHELRIAAQERQEVKHASQAISSAAAALASGAPQWC